MWMTPQLEAAWRESQASPSIQKKLHQEAGDRRSMEAMPASNNQQCRNDLMDGKGGALGQEEEPQALHCPSLDVGLSVTSPPLFC